MYSKSKVDFPFNFGSEGIQINANLISSEPFSNEKGPEEIKYNKILYYGQTGAVLNYKDYIQFRTNLKNKMKAAKHPVINSFNLFTYGFNAPENSDYCYYLIYELDYSSLKGIRMCFEEKQKKAYEESLKQFENEFDQKYPLYVKNNELNFINMEYQTSIPFIVNMYEKQYTPSKDGKTIGQSTSLSEPKAVELAVQFRGITIAAKNEKEGAQDLSFSKFATCHVMKLNEVGVNENSKDLTDEICLAVRVKLDNDAPYVDKILCSAHPNDNYKQVVKKLLYTRIYQNCNRINIDSITNFIPELKETNINSIADKTKLAVTINDILGENSNYLYNMFISSKNKYQKRIDNIKASKDRLLEMYVNLMNVLQCEDKSAVDLPCDKKEIPDSIKKVLEEERAYKSGLNKKGKEKSTEGVIEGAMEDLRKNNEKKGNATEAVKEMIKEEENKPLPLVEDLLKSQPNATEEKPMPLLEDILKEEPERSLTDFANGEFIKEAEAQAAKRQEKLNLMKEEDKKKEEEEERKRKEKKEKAEKEKEKAEKEDKKKADEKALEERNAENEKAQKEIEEAKEKERERKRKQKEKEEKEKKKKEEEAKKKEEEEMQRQLEIQQKLAEEEFQREEEEREKKEKEKAEKWKKREFIDLQRPPKVEGSPKQPPIIFGNIIVSPELATPK
ncbi:MAG: hypothetical protein MJ252_04575 [archaeon]|nr:hypothetical protein [archaeon]